MGRSSWEDAPLVTVNPLKLRREAATFGRFAVVGLIGAVIDFSVLNLLIFAAGWASPLQMAAANVVSTSAAILSNFFLNRSWTFRHAAGERRTQFLQFVAVSAVGLVINAVVFFLANHYIFGPLLHTGIAVQLSKAAAIGVGMFWNFIANRLWTFRNRKGSAVMNVTDTPATPAAPGALPGGAGAKRGPVSGILVRRWLLPLGVGLLLLAVLNLGLYRRLAPPSAAAMPAAEQTAAVDAAPAAEAPAAAPADAPAPTAAPAAPAAAPAADSAARAAGAARFAADFSADGGASGWRLLDGDWQIVDGALVQTLPDGYDRIALYGEPFDTSVADYVLRVRFKLLAGTGAGILFSTTGPDSKNGGHMVRFTDDGTGLFWGRFSPAGAFESQGYAAAGAPGADWHVLEIAAAGGTYAIRLDSAQVAAGVPLLSTGGYIGLTTSQSSAAYAAVEVFDATQAPAAADAAAVATPAADTAAAATADTALSSSGLEFNTISGDWVQDGALIRQENSKATDFSLGTGVSAENYTLELAVTLPADAALTDAGGGILFHMPERNRKEGSQMVRFVDGGKGLTWGSFGADGAFSGEGYVELNLTPGEPLQMALTVRGGVFDVQINGEPVVQDVPTAAQGGWIGLISYRGPVTFEDVKLTLGSVVP